METETERNATSRVLLWETAPNAPTRQPRTNHARPFQIPIPPPVPPNSTPPPPSHSHSPSRSRSRSRSGGVTSGAAQRVPFAVGFPGAAGTGTDTGGYVLPRRVESRESRRGEARRGEAPSAKSPTPSRVAESQGGLRPVRARRRAERAGVCVMCMRLYGAGLDPLPRAGAGVPGPVRDGTIRWYAPHTNAPDAPGHRFTGAPARRVGHASRRGGDWWTVVVGRPSGAAGLG